MSKVKEQMMQEQQEELELELSYREWLRDSYEEPTAVEIDAMEAENKFVITKETIYLYLHSTNNPEYRISPKGA